MMAKGRILMKDLLAFILIQLMKIKCLDLKAETPKVSAEYRGPDLRDPRLLTNTPPTVENIVSC